MPAELKPLLDFLLNPMTIAYIVLTAVVFFGLQGAAAVLARLLGSPIEPEITQTGRTFDIRHNTADISRARETLGFAPKVTLEQGFGELIAWAKSSPDGAVDMFERAFDELKAKGLLVDKRG